MSKYDICILGLGYIGLPTAICFAETGKKVLGVDIDHDLLSEIQQGKSPISETGLQPLLTQTIKNNNFIAGASPERSCVYIIAVPTPFYPDSKKPNLEYVEAAVVSIIDLLDEGDLIIFESTCPVGTTRYFESYIFQERQELTNKIFFAYCPERVLPGNILYEIKNNNRVVGGLCENSTLRAVELYEVLTAGEVLSVSSAETAEFVKLIENSYRDVNIAFANELSKVCESIPVSVFEAIKVANMHPRVQILQPGCGVGGHCIAVDPWFLVDAYGADVPLIKTARLVNDLKPKMIIDKVKHLKKMHLDKKIICLGLTFKPDVSDVRESPALQIFNELKLTYGGEVHALDPNLRTGQNLNELKLSDVEMSDDIILLLVAHKEFKNLKPSSAIIIDTCGVW